MLSSVCVYLGLGSNLDSPIVQLENARHSIAQLADVSEIAFSSLYRSAPMRGSPAQQPDYINAVMAINTNLPALVLLRHLQAIENQQGRVRNERWGARTLDIDILLYGDQCIDVPDLCVPHVGLAQRAFVLYPLHDIAPHLHIPQLGFIADLLTHCPLAGLQRLS